MHLEDAFTRAEAQFSNVLLGLASFSSSVFSINVSATDGDSPGGWPLHGHPKPLGAVPSQIQGSPDTLMCQHHLSTLHLFICLFCNRVINPIFK